MEKKAGERDAVVRGVGFLAEDLDLEPALGIGRSQCLNEALGDHACSDDDDLLGTHGAPPPLALTRPGNRGVRRATFARDLVLRG
ncbi:hypothetical protein GCM10025876_04900 [Demequina litorisediminis]|uniref:Uncharacterized protein n=1 Tax=Demequina litorisediminis TaxID=1849022 RepID=A0ABQ6I992_9MICO|nr:hypothetical protein GCM10025876_04900 [Demequina litorisediminis]